VSNAQSPIDEVPRRLQIERSQEGDRIILGLVGELDIETTPDFDPYLEELKAGPPRSFVIDLGRLTFMDSSGLRLVSRAQKAAVANDHQLAFRRGPRQVQRLLMFTELDKLLTFEDRPPSFVS
jgi:anti-anti-sigma factor